MKNYPLIYSTGEDASTILELGIASRVAGMKILALLVILVLSSFLELQASEEDSCESPSMLVVGRSDRRIGTLP